MLLGVHSSLLVVINMNIFCNILTFINDFANKINAVKSVPKELPSNNWREINIYKYTKHRGNISYKKSIQQLLKENYNDQSYHNVLGINTYS